MIICDPICDVLLGVVKMCIGLAVYLIIVFLIDILTE